MTTANLRLIMRTRLVRYGAGAAVSVAFVILTVSRVNLAQTASALAEAALPAAIIALALIWIELLVRAARWQFLLRPFAIVTLGLSAAYLCVGYFANTLLPARLGDVGRAYLTGQSFGVPRLTTFGTILVERLADGLMILGVVIVLGLGISPIAGLRDTALEVAVVGVVVGVALFCGLLLVRRLSLTPRRPVAAASRFLSRLAAGGRAVSDPRGLATTILLTLLAFGVAVAAFDCVGASVGLAITPAQAALVMGALALSLAIPAAPASIGTYEFVGVSVLVALGYPAEASLAAVVLMHLLSVLPLALAGLVVTWALHVRLASITDPPPTAAGAMVVVE